MQIYLTNELEFKEVQNLILNELIFYDFKVDLNLYDALIITSKNAIKALKKTKSILNFDLKVYAVGENTAKEAFNLGFKNVKYPKLSYASNLYEEFKEELRDKKCLYLRAKELSSNLVQKLLGQNVNLTQIIAYENIYKKPNVCITHPCIVIFTSPSCVNYFLKTYDIKEEDYLIAIGESTAKQLLKYNNVLVCKNPNLEECIQIAKNLKANL
ncbi:uroporphyrinogen-III synthase [Campylobacter novaezeelandiae]|uniref:Uroporphyrinogen-III synthase n=1 Tax=Campylobacter novaezeelandiae TaxID=2267891 RepID=A0A4Q9JTM2_9BACT|nr:uroporphyrinogen-III synthase [Campylobacter novaezeelandiae]QWU80389.1 uroporphyrinogen III synthase [Campylobacter novaezeelandiae]TBR77935.1 uroporphyrinogen-III synthase [Campylobacter novaezeelandiae]TBR78189.1 uroporphyrinogen-III synthase [Campylobacter novaezeelandiae]TBR79662.1 uroporphyrinogen-III synthase [Campylobacter novaezeelandiae]